MKKIITLIVLFTLLITNIALFAQESQSQSQSNLQQTFNFDNESGEKVIELRVGASIEKISFNFQSQILSGSLEMSIFDPNGKREGGFTLQANSDANATRQNEGTKSGISISSSSKSSSNTSSNSTSSSISSSGQNTFASSTDKVHQYVMHSANGQSMGTMNKAIENPIAGTWTVNIEMHDLKGDLSVDMKQIGQE